MSTVEEVNAGQFESAVLKETLPVLVDFWAPWCGPCKMMGPVLEDLAKELDGRLKIVKVNVDENNELAGNFNVMSIPTLILFKGGRSVETFMGAQPKQALASKLESHV